MSLYKAIQFCLLIGCMTGLCPTALSQPVKIIFETDMETDSDDAAALAMLHYYADQKMVDLLAVVSNSRSPDSVAGIDAINTYYGRPDLPIGAYQGDSVGRSNTPIYRQINERADLYPHNINHRSEVPDAVSLYTELLSAHQGVVIISTGYLQNIAALLDAAGGKALVAKSVEHMVVVGGSVGRMNGEHNLTVAGSATSARFVLSHFPRPMLFTPAEVGSSIVTGRELDDNPQASPVRAAFDILGSVRPNILFPHGPHAPSSRADVPLKAGRPSWDQIGVLVGVFGPTDNFDVVAEGYMYVEDWERGVTQWRTRGRYSNRDNHRYLVKAVSDQTIAEQILVAMDYDPAAP